MADNPADQETMRSSARFFAEAIDIHREHHSSQDAVAYNQLHEDLEIDLSEGAAKLQERFNWLEKDLRLYADADEISADDKEGLLRYTQRVIETAVELSAMRSEHAALGVFLKKGPKEGALEADQILNKGDLFAKLKIPENLREWFGENILAPTLAKEFSARKDVGQETLKQVNSNIRTIERWNLAEGEAHLSRYAAQVKFYQDKKNADAVKEAEDRYKKLSRKLEDETRDLFKDQVINGVRRHGELKILYKLADNPAIGRQPVVEAAESAPPVPEIDLQSKPALVERQEVPKPAAVPKPADSVTSTPAPDLTKGISAAPVSTDTTGTGTQTIEPKADTDTTIDPKAGYETAMQILHKKGLALNPDYQAEAAEATLKSFVEYYLSVKFDEKIAPDDAEKLDGLTWAAELYHRADGDFEKMISRELLEDVLLFTNPPPLTPPPNTGAGGNGTATSAEQAETDAGQPNDEPSSPVITEADLKTFADMARNLDYDALVKQMSDKAQNGKLTAMDIIAMLDEELNPEPGYKHEFAKDEMRQFLTSSKMDPDQDVSPGDHDTIEKLAKLALAYRLSRGESIKGNPAKVAALYAAGDSAEKATLDDAVSRFVSALGKYHKEEKPKADASSTGNDPVSTKSPGADSAVTPPQTQDGLLNPDNLNWGYLLGGGAAATAGALAIRKIVKSRSAAQPAAPAQPATPAAGAAANNTTNTPAGANGQTGQPTGANTAGNNGQTVHPNGTAAGTNSQTGAQPAGTNPPAPQNQPSSQATQQAPANNPPTAKDIQKIDEKIKKHEATIKSQNEKLFQLKEAYDRLKPSSTEGIAVKDSIEKLEEEIKKTHGKLYRREQELKTIRQNSGGAHNPVTTPHAGGSPVSPVVTPTPGPTVTTTPSPGPTLTPVNPAVSPTPLGPPAPLAPGAQPAFIGPPAPQPGPGTPPPQNPGGPAVNPTTQTTMTPPPANPNVSVWGSARNFVSGHMNTVRTVFNQHVGRNLGAISIATGADGLADSIRRDDTGGMVLNSASILTGGASVAQNFVTSPMAAGAMRFAGSKLPWVYAATGAYEIGSQEGDFVITNSDGTSSFGDKTLRALEITATVGGTIVAGTALATAGVAATPALIATAVVGYGATKVAEVGTSLYRLNHEEGNLKRLNEEAAKPDTGDKSEREASGAPAIRNYKNLTVFALSEAKKTSVDDHFEHVRKTNYSDPKELQKLEKGLNARIAELRKTLDANKSVVRDWLRWDRESVSKKRDAESQLAPLLAAQKELEIYKKDLVSHASSQVYESDLRQAQGILYSGWNRAEYQLKEAAKGGFSVDIVARYDRDGDGKLSVGEITIGLVKNNIKSRKDLDTDVDDVISKDDVTKALRRGLDGTKDLAGDQFAKVAPPVADPTLVGPGGIKIEPLKK